MAVPRQALPEYFLSRFSVADGLLRVKYVPGAFTGELVISGQLAGGLDAGRRVRDPHSGDDPRLITVSTSGQGNGDGLAVLLAGEDRDSGVDRLALGRVEGHRIRQPGVIAEVCPAQKERRRPQLLPGSI